MHIPHIPSDGIFISFVQCVLRCGHVSSIPVICCGKTVQPDCDISFLATHEYIKYLVETHMVDTSLGNQMFLHTAPGATANAFILASFENVFASGERGEISGILNNKFIMVGKTMFVCTYMDRASGRLHDIVISKLPKYFFAGIPCDQPLSTTSIASAFSQQVRASG